MNITFDDNLITGNKTIDSQHQELIDRIRQFVAACESGDSKIKAIKMLDYLDEYTNFHFQEEEELQKKCACIISGFTSLIIRLTSFTVRSVIGKKLIFLSTNASLIGPFGLQYIISIVSSR